MKKLFLKSLYDYSFLFKLQKNNRFCRKSSLRETFRLLNFEKRIDYIGFQKPSPLLKIRENLVLEIARTDEKYASLYDLNPRFINLSIQIYYSPLLHNVLLYIPAYSYIRIVTRGFLNHIFGSPYYIMVIFPTAGPTRQLTSK